MYLVIWFFFTNKEYTPFIEEVRANFKNKTQIITLELDEFEALQKYPRSVWEQFNKEYDEMIEYYLTQNRFIGKDQSIMASMFIKNKDLFTIIDKNQHNWLTLLYYLAGI